MMIQNKDSHDPVIEEIHQTRRNMADKFGGDISAILEDARKRQAEAGRPLWQGEASDHSAADDSPSATE